MDLSKFNEVPQWAIDELSKHEPTKRLNDRDYYHETQFEMAGIMCQTAVINGKYTSLPQDQINTLTRIIAVFGPDFSKTFIF